MKKFTMSLVWHNCEDYPPSENYNDSLIATDGYFIFQVEYHKINGWWNKDRKTSFDKRELKKYYWADLKQTVRGCSNLPNRLNIYFMEELFMVKKYIKKPVEIEAVQWTGENLEEIYEFVGIKNLCFNSKAVDEEIGELYINTLEGDMHAAVNDFIIKGIKGEFYPCKPDIFNDSYIEKLSEV